MEAHQSLNLGGRGGEWWVGGWSRGHTLNVGVLILSIRFCLRGLDEQGESERKGWCKRFEGLTVCKTESSLDWRCDWFCRHLMIIWPSGLISSGELRVFHQLWMRKNSHQAFPLLVREPPTCRRTNLCCYFLEPSKAEATLVRGSFELENPALWHFRGVSLFGQGIGWFTFPMHHCKQTKLYTGHLFIWSSIFLAFQTRK